MINVFILVVNQYLIIIITVLLINWLTKGSAYSRFGKHKKI